MPRSLEPLRVFVDPVDEIPKQVTSGRWLPPMLALAMISAISGLVIALRFDAAAAVIPAMEASGELAKASEREIADAVQTAYRTGIVASIAKGLVLVPVSILFLGFALKLTAALIGRKGSWKAFLTAAAVGLMPLLVYQFLRGILALRLVEIPPSGLGKILPTAPVIQGPGILPKIVPVLDFFNLWCAALLGLGFSAATDWKAWKGVAVGMLLYLAYAGVVLIGISGIGVGKP